MDYFADIKHKNNWKNSSFSNFYCISTAVTNIYLIEGILSRFSVFTQKHMLNFGSFSSNLDT